MAGYRLLSSDSHVIEPVDLWKKRIDPRFRDRAPQVVRDGDHDQWCCDGTRFGAIGSNQQAGVRFEEPEKLNRDGTMDTAPLGGLDPQAHVRDLALDGVAGGVLYPSQGLSLWRVPASDILSAVFRAYNDYLAEFCKPCPGQLKGIAMINVDDVEDAVCEMERAAKLGLSGAMITVRPMLRYDHPTYEQLWAASQDLDMPLSLHIGTARWRPGVDLLAAAQDALFFATVETDVRESLGAIILSGVFQRFPKLRVGAIEFEVLWAPYFMGRIDNVYKERAIGISGYRFKSDALPSDFFRSNIFISFQEDDLGIRLRHEVGVENLMWGSDYPHAESTFPRSREIVDRILKDVPEDEKALIAGENTARLYHFS